MYKTKKNILLVILAVVSEVAISILYYFGIIQNGFNWTLIVAAFCGIAMIAINALTDFPKSFFAGLLLFTVLSGVGQLSLSIGYTASYLYTQAQNMRTISIITNDSENGGDNYHSLMSYDGYDYYIDSGYTYVYKIKEDGFSSKITAFNIYIDSDVESVFEDNFGDFYSIKDKKAFCNLGRDLISISFVKNRNDSSAFIKIVSPQNKVFYTYFPIDNSSQLISDLGIVYERYNVGSTDFILTTSSKIVNGTQIGNNEILNYQDGKQYIVSTSGAVFLSDAIAISFGDDIGYTDRINYFIYSDYIVEIEEYKKELSLLEPESDEAKEVSAYISTLESQMPIKACEMVYEFIGTTESIRLYRTRNYTDSLQTTPPITVIEIEKDGYYIYGYTELELDDLF